MKYATRKLTKYHELVSSHFRNIFVSILSIIPQERASLFQLEFTTKKKENGQSIVVTVLIKLRN